MDIFGHQAFRNDLFSVFRRFLKAEKNMRFKNGYLLKILPKIINFEPRPIKNGEKYHSPTFQQFQKESF
jgi:hypothetical protein